MIDAHIELLTRTRVFEGLHLDQVHKIIAIGEEKLLPSGETFMHEGAVEDTLWMINDGEIEVYKVIRGDVDRTLACFHAGEVLGELEFVSGGARAACARTAQPSQFFVISRDALSEVIKKDPNLGVTFYKNIASTLAERLRVTNELYRESVARGLESVGAASLNLHRLTENLSQVTILLSHGQKFYGRLLQVDQTAAGFSLVIKDSESGNLTVIPYHAVQAISMV